MRKTLWILIIWMCIAVPIQAQEMTHLRFGHFSPTVRVSVEVYLNEEASELNALRYSEISEWLDLPAGNYTVSFRVNGEVITDTLRVESKAGDWNTVVFIDDLQIIKEDTSPLADGKSRITVLQSVEGLSSLNIRLDQTIFYRELDDMLNADIVSNTYRFAFETSGETLIALDELTLEEGQHTFVVLTGTSASPRIITLTLPPAGESGSEQALVRFAHLSSGTPALDFYLDGQLTGFRNMRFPEFTNWVALPAGNYTLAVTLRGDSLADAVIEPTQITLAAGTYTTTTVIGALANDTLQAHFFEEDFTELSVNRFRLGVFNAHPGTGAVDVRLADGTTMLIERLGYPGFFGNNDGFSELILERGVYDLQIVRGADILIDLSGTTFIEGRNYLIAVISADPPFWLTFSDVGETRALLNEE
jgi:hypothetical protein